MDCAEFHVMLDNYANLGEAEKARLGEHAEHCPECKAELDFLLSVLDTVKTLPKIEPPSDFLEKLNERIDAEERKKKKGSLYIFAKKYKSYSGLAACLLLAAVIGVNGHQLGDRLTYRDDSAAVSYSVTPSGVTDESRGTSPAVSPFPAMTPPAQTTAPSPGAASQAPSVPSASFVPRAGGANPSGAAASSGSSARASARPSASASTARDTASSPDADRQTENSAPAHANTAEDLSGSHTEQQQFAPSGREFSYGAGDNVNIRQNQAESAGDIPSSDTAPANAEYSSVPAPIYTAPQAAPEITPRPAPSDEPAQISESAAEDNTLIMRSVTQDEADGSASNAPLYDKTDDADTGDVAADAGGTETTVYGSSSASGGHSGGSGGSGISSGGGGNTGGGSPSKEASTLSDDAGDGMGVGSIELHGADPSEISAARDILRAYAMYMEDDNYIVLSDDLTNLVIPALSAAGLSFDWHSDGADILRISLICE